MSYCVIRSFGRIFIFEEYIVPYKGWLIVDVHGVSYSTTIHSHSQLHSCHYYTYHYLEQRTQLLHSIMAGKLINTYTSKPSNSQCILFTDISYTKLTARINSCHSFDNPLSSSIDLFVLNCALVQVQLIEITKSFFVFSPVIVKA